MEYTNNEKQILSFMKRVDFKNISKKDLVSYASKLNELRPEVAQQVIAQLPELVKLIQSAMIEYKGVLEKIVASDDESTNRVYDIFNKEINIAADSRKEFIEYADKIHTDLSKCLDNTNLTAEQQKDILDRQMEIFRAVDKKDTKFGNRKWKWIEWLIKGFREKKSLIGRCLERQVLFSLLLLILVRLLWAVKWISRFLS